MRHLYLVREKVTKRICGIVHADDIRRVYYTVDGFGTPEEYEVTVLNTRSYYGGSAVWFCTKDEKEYRENDTWRTTNQEPEYYGKNWTEEEWKEQFETEECLGDLTLEQYKKDCEEQFKRSSFVPEEIYLDWDEGWAGIINGNHYVPVEWTPIRHPRRSPRPKTEAPQNIKRRPIPRNPNWKLDKP